MAESPSPHDDHSSPAVRPITVIRHPLDSGTVCVLTMDAGENRWNTSFTRAFDAALDEVEATTGPTTLVTTSSNPKFFSNGLDLAWITGPAEGEAVGGERRVFAAEAMALFARLITPPASSRALRQRSWAHPTRSRRRARTHSHW